MDKKLLVGLGTSAAAVAAAILLGDTRQSANVFCVIGRDGCVVECFDQKSNARISAAHRRAFLGTNTTVREVSRDRARVVLRERGCDWRT
jgi:hypothetical protein